jgi:hypothetical protein
MMVDRKAAVAAYKERKTPWGIYAVRCNATGQVWIGRGLDLDKIENRLRFTLRLGGVRPASLQDAWNRHGEKCFAIETLERMEEEEEAGFVRNNWFKARLNFWREELSAEII